MAKVNLQAKTKPIKAELSYYYFGNQKIGLNRTEFHRIVIPLEKFETGLNGDTKPISTSIIFDWIELDSPDWEAEPETTITSDTHSEMEATILIGNVEVRCFVNELNLKRIESNKFRISGVIVVEFEIEDMADDEIFRIDCVAEYLGEKK